LLEFAQQFGGAYLSTEGALWRTLRLLILRPGELSRQYLQGRRKHFVLPLRLYLTVSVLALLVLRLTGGLGLNNLDDPGLAAEINAHRQDVGIQLIVARAGLKKGEFFCEGLPDWICHRIQTRIDFDPAALLKQIRAVIDQIASNWSAVMFVLMPAFALGLRLLYARRRMRYTEHLVVALHLHAFWFMALAGARLFGAVGSVLGPCAILVYAYLALRRVYEGAWWQLSWRLAVLAAAYGSLILVALSVLALIALVG
jgi:hypothetical protein